MDTTDVLMHLKTSKELLVEGFTYQRIARSVERGELTRVRFGVFCNRAWLTNLKPYEKYWVRVLAVYKAHPESVFSHSAAALLLGLSVVSAPELVDVQGAAVSRGRTHGIRKHYTYKPLQEHTVLACGAKVTGPLQTVVDCARFLPRDEAVCIADSALQQRLVSFDDVSRAISDLQGRGAYAAQRAHEYFTALSESPGESLLKLVMRDGGLPEPVQQLQVVFWGHTFRLDFAFESEKNAIEFDGRVKYQRYGSAEQVLIDESEREKVLRNNGWLS